MDIREGDRVFTDRHKHELVVTTVGRKALLCRRICKNGSVGRGEFMIMRQDLTAMVLRLPGC